MAVPPFHALYAAGFFGVASPSSSHLPWPSPTHTGLGSLLTPRGANVLDAAGFASCCGPAVCTLLARARPRASTPGSPRTPAGYYEGSWYLLRPDSHRQVIVGFQDTLRVAFPHAVSSQLPLASVLPSGEQATEDTPTVCSLRIIRRAPLRIIRRAPLCASQSRTVWVPSARKRLVGS